MARRNYSSSAQGTTLAAAITNTATTLSAQSQPGGWPVAPFTIAIERGGTNEELLLVTAVSGTGPFTFDVVRGFNGTSAVAHSAGVSLEHTVGGIDYDEANVHVNATTEVHGLAAGDVVVGRTATQTLTNKTLTAPVISDLTNAQHDHSTAAKGGEVAGGGLNSAILLMGA